VPYYIHNNISVNVYGAVIIARVHAVDWVNADSAPGGRRPSNQANQLWL